MSGNFIFCGNPEILYELFDQSQVKSIFNIYIGKKERKRKKNVTNVSLIQAELLTF